MAFDTALNAVAGSLKALGNTDPEQVRRAKAVGVLADPQYALDLHTDAIQGFTGIAGSTTDHGTGHVARVPRLGPRALETVEQWLGGLTPGARVTVTPVVDLNESISVDAHEAPDRLRNQVDERDHTCVFPWCGRRGRYDLDHIEPYVDPDEGGPPGQTSTANLAKVCRFHHRVKTHSEWDYRREPDGSLTWTSPLGRSYTVDHQGATALD